MAYANPDAACTTPAQRGQQHKIYLYTARSLCYTVIVNVGPVVKQSYTGKFVTQG